MPIPSLPAKILMTTDTVGGVWTYSVLLIKALAAHNFEVHLASMGRPINRSQHQQLQQLDNVKIYESDYKLEWMDDPWQDVEQSKIWIEKLYKKINPDLVHLNTFAHGTIDFDAPVLITGHSCVLSWWQAVKNESAPKAYFRYQKEVKTGLEQADMVTAPSKAMLEQLDIFYGPFTRSRYIANGIHLPSAGSFKWPYVLSIGRIWDEAKNIGVLPKISRKISWKICLAGETSPPGQQKRSLGKDVHYLGYLPHSDILNLMSEASIYILPARYEPFGLTILEAAAAGCALVLGDIPSLREHWDEAAVFVDPNDTQQIHYQLNKLINNNQLRNELAHSAQQRAQKFSLQKMGNDYLQVYKDLVKTSEFVDSPN